MIDCCVLQVQNVLENELVSSKPVDLGKCITPPSQHTDWTKVHRQAYITALATSKARKLIKQLKKGKDVCELFDNMLTPSFKYSYFSKGNSEGRKTGSKNNKNLVRGRDVYKYYPSKSKAKV